MRMHHAARSRADGRLYSTLVGGSTGRPPTGAMAGRRAPPGSGDRRGGGRRPARRPPSACGRRASGRAVGSARQLARSANSARSSRLFSAWPERWPLKRPRSGAPASARSPTTSSSLWRTNSSGLAQPAGVQHQRPVHHHRIGQAAALRQAGGAQPRDLLGQGEGAGIGQAGAEGLRREAQRERLPADGGGREIDGQRGVEAGSPAGAQLGPGRVRAVAVLHPDRAQHLDRLARRRRRCGDDAGAVDQEHEGRGGAVQDRHFRAVDLDHARRRCRSRPAPPSRARPCRCVRCGVVRAGRARCRAGCRRPGRSGAGMSRPRSVRRNTDAGPGRRPGAA